EKDIDNVLQTQNIFSNVSKGQLANVDDIVKAFGNQDNLSICKEILMKGELQVSEKERQLALENITKEVAHFLADTCVNPETKRPYPITLIEKCMQELHFSPHPSKPVKVQAKELLKLIQTQIPIERTQMRVRVLLPKLQGKKVKEPLFKFFSEIETDTLEGDVWCMVGLVDPGQYKGITEYLLNETKGQGKIELLRLCTINDSGESKLLY
ncbi:hypothetical protein HMI54_010192, partial [Coelomomyces lativittatus]